MNFNRKSSFSKLISFIAVMMVVYLTSCLFGPKNAPRTKTDNREPCDLCMLNDSHVKANIRPLGYMRYTDSEKAQFKSLVDRKAASNDPELVEFVRKVIDPPRTLSFIKMTRNLVITPQATAIDKFLGNQVKGFFVEAGAYDGEISSNSIFFEIKRSWTGLLVEPDPYFYTQLVGKNRACWSINACLSTSPFVTEMSFQESTDARGKLVKGASQKVPCFPLEAILLAINVTTVDFFSLDVEGLELDVLKTLLQSDKKSINIRTLAVEFIHGDENDYKKYMASKGYNMSARISFQKPEIGLYVEDFIFVKIA